MRISFIILHYLTGQVTSSCINAVLSISGAYESDIVVVDNASGNGSFEMLSDNFIQHRNVHFLTLPSNEGFARGNNAGYRFAKEKLNPDFIVVLNNDVLIEDKKFIEKVEKEYARAPFAVLGPDIFCPATGRHQNPAHLNGFTENELAALKDKLSEQLKRYFLRKLCWQIKLILGLAKKPNPGVGNSDPLYTNPYSDCVLHGACYIFSKDFIEVRDNAFNPGTFLYFEEDILHLECMRGRLAMRYTPDIQVLHLEDAATNAAISSRLARDKAKKERMLESVDFMLTLIGKHES